MNCKFKFHLRAALHRGAGRAGGAPFFGFSGLRFALENRVLWLCGQAGANRAGVREPCRPVGSFFRIFRSTVRARKPSSLALRAGVREPRRPAGSFFRIFRSAVRSNYFALTNIHEGKKQQTTDMADNHQPYQWSLLSFFHYYLYTVTFLSSSSKSSSESFRTNKSSTGISKIHARKPSPRQTRGF